MVPRREHWRLIPALLDDAVCVDIELDQAGQLTALAVRTRARAASWVRGDRREEAFELMTQAPAMVTFNGMAFDVPRLRAARSELVLPVLHLDLYSMTRRLRMVGGYKTLEARAGWQRAPHVAGLRGEDAVQLWRRWEETGDREALQLLCEYNMEDVWSLPAMAAFVYNEIARRAHRGAPGAPPPPSASRVWHQRAEGGPMMLRAVQDCLQSVEDKMSPTLERS
jgi:uncharacterized protein YprB with RNaseH-like and TPR domain